MIKWIRPSGRPITTNESQASIDYAKLHKWEREGEKFVNVVETVEVEMSHEKAINSLSTKDALKSHLSDVHGVKIDMRGSMEHVKSKAIKAVDECLQQRNS